VKSWRQTNVIQKDRIYR